jgi:hypothetical protein
VFFLKTDWMCFEMLRLKPMIGDEGWRRWMAVATRQSMMVLFLCVLSSTDSGG